MQTCSSGKASIISVRLSNCCSSSMQSIYPVRRVGSGKYVNDVTYIYQPSTVKS